MQINVFLLYGKGPERLTEEEAHRLSVFCFNQHNHLATRPQPSLFWWRLPEELSYRA